MLKYLILITFIASTSAACGGSESTIPGTRIAESPQNRDVIDALEEYRLAVERKDTAALMLMASPKYWEDSGTMTGGDDYGYDGLRDVLTGRFQEADDIRYSMRYMSIRRRCPSSAQEGNDGCRVYVEVLIDASFTVTDARGEPKRPDKRDQNELVLSWENDRWKFLSGM
jgi:hypothetical protein